MKVVMVNKFAHVTAGADQHCLALAQVLRRRGHDVRFLSTRDDANVEREGAFVECLVTHRSRDSLSRAGQLTVLVNALWNREAASAMRRLVHEFRPDVVHTHKLYPQLSVAPVVVAARAGVPIVQTLHDFEMISASAIDVRGGRWDRDESRLRFRLLNLATLPARERVHVQKVSEFIAVSRFVARVHAGHGIEASVLPNFVAAAEAPGGPGPGYGERRGIVFWGRLRPEKGVVDVVEMARRLPAIQVTIVGSGVLEDFVRSQAESLPNLRVTGYVPDDELAAIVRGARVVVIPSRCQDAGPLVPLESMANGTPVVAYANGGLGEYVIDSGGGAVVPVDVDALAKASAELHDRPALWKQFSERGRAAVRQRHTAEVYAEHLEQVYERAAA